MSTSGHPQQITMHEVLNLLYIVQQLAYVGHLPTGSYRFRKRRVFLFLVFLVEACASYSKSRLAGAA